MATIIEVAKKAGVSPSTASIVVNGKARERKISVETEQRVLEAAREIGYTPNLSARILRGVENQKYRVALYWTTDFRLTLMVRFLKGLQQHIIDQKIPVEFVVITYLNGKLSEAVTPHGLLHYHGAIICNANQDDLDYLDETEFFVPIVLYNRFLEKYSTVNIDNYRIGETAAKQALKNQRTSILLLDQEPHFPGIEQRILGFEETLSKHHIETNTFLTTNKQQEGAEIAQELIDQSRLPDFVFSLSDHAALGFIRSLMVNQVKIPEEVEVMAIGTIESEFHENSIVPLSTVDIPMEKMAQKCLDLIIYHLEDPLAKLQTVLIEVDVHPRNSTLN